MTTLLVIDDDIDVLKCLQRILETEGYKVVTASDGEEGIALAQSSFPDLVLSDISMPSIDGYSVLSALQADSATSDIPVIFLTCSSRHLDIRRGMELGAQDYLCKPMCADELLAAIRIRLKQRKERNERAEKCLSKQRRQMTSNLSHELRTPLSGILPIPDMLDMCLPAERPKSIDVISNALRKSTRRLNATVERFLCYSEVCVLLEMGRREWVKPGNTRIAAEVRKHTTECANDWFRGEDLRLDLSEIRAGMGANFLRHLVRQLVDNAFKFSHRGRLVTVALRAEGTHLLLRVIDQGRGMTPEQIASVGPFQQFDRAHYEQQGSGLGLAIVQGIARLYGGGFLLESEQGSGLIATVRLPMQRA